MAYDETLADRIRAVVIDQPGIDEKKMFGGLAFLLNGNMAAGVSSSNLIVRLHPDDYQAALAQPGAAVFDMTGKPMKGWVLVDSAVLDDDAELERWVKQGIQFAGSLPPK
ncbi:MAG: TfoX/Sxy family protein [Thermomicrobiales bacterium]